MSTLSERVSRGVELLNRTRPDWRKEIDTDRLNMMSPTDCILGQLYGWFPRGRIVLNLDDVGYPEGFHISIKESDTDAIKHYNELTGEWKKQLEVIK